MATQAKATDARAAAAEREHEQAVLQLRFEQDKKARLGCIRGVLKPLTD